MRCLLTGALTEPARTHPKIKGLGGVGGKVETTLVSFNEPAFCSFGLDQSRNGAVSKEAAEQYAAALNHLIEHNSVTLAGTKVVYWYDREVPPEYDPVRAQHRDERVEVVEVHVAIAIDVAFQARARVAGVRVRIRRTDADRGHEAVRVVVVGHTVAVPLDTAGRAKLADRGAIGAARGRR